ncbi:class I SAM-dependent methyltransferase [Pendulispora albinea]|uniref:Class I SAM-dependent methyltransferase n=1 Tax=Pendulispora albinea TaxID=2741071 RepID=A0ABZ2MCD1_9BACT
MLKAIAHFVRNGPEVLRMQKQHSRAEFLDLFNEKADAQGYADVRRELVGDLAGSILEIGCGTGSMFRYYGERARVDAIEPEEDFLERAVAKAQRTSGKIHAMAGDGMNLPFSNGSFDTVVICLVLCSVASTSRVLAEAFRVLRGGGQLRALEHVRSGGAVAGLLMDLGNPLWLRINKQGCNWNRDPLAALSEAGFWVDDVRAFQRFDTMMPAFPMRLVKAHKPR